MKNLLSLALIGLAATAVACDQQSTVTDLEVEPSFSFENAPNNTGVVVRRDNVMAGMILFAGEYIAYHGLDPRTGACIDEFWNDEQWDIQTVETPSGLEHFHMMGESVHTSVWPYPEGYDCDYVVSHGPIAEGFSNLTQTTTSGHTWRIQAHGRLNTPSGDPVNYLGRQLWVKDHNGWHGDAFGKLAFTG